MEVTLNKLSPVLVELAVEVEAERVRAELQKAYQALAKTARVRGFRPGKAPRKVLKNMFGARVAADVAQQLVDATFPEAVSGQNVQTVSQPQFEPKKLVENEPFSYKARVEVVPEIESVKFDGLEAKRPKVEVTKQMIEEELESVREAQATLESPKERRPAKKGDVVTMDFTVDAGGQAVEDAGAEDLQVEVGGGQLLPEIDAALEGAEPGGHAHAEVTMPDAHPHPKLKGQKVKFHITVKDLKERVLPELDDELAKDLGDYDDLDALRADIKAGIEKRLKEQGENAVAEALVAELVKANPIPIPPSLVQRQMQITEQEVLQQARRQGQQATGVSDELRAKIQNDSEIKVRAGLLMAEIAKSEGIKIGDEEIEEGVKELAEQSGKNVAKLRVEYRDSKKREMLIGMILENKVLDIIEAKSKITDE